MSTDLLERGREVLAAQGFSALLGTDVLTPEFKINYLRPATGERLHAVATMVGSGRTQAVCRCDVFAEVDGERKLCAAAQGTIRKTG